MYKLLIVEDEELERQVLYKQICDSQLPVKIVGEAADGYEAIKLFSTTRAEIILIDIKMPGMNGLDAVKTIKEMDQRVEVIFITAYSSFSYSNSALKLRAADYLLKPVRPQELVASIQRVIDFIEEKRNGEEEVLHGHPQDAVTGEQENDTVRTIKKFILENYDQRLTLQTFAELLYYNPSYISTVFKKTTGQGITEYITEVRIAKAKELLLSTNDSVDEIASRVGLSNNSYLTAVFKKNLGICPSEYRRQFSQWK
ncbi:MAG: response regulator [Clostridia bacterium]|jgi:two-component system response regulator YesN|nr:response regulator [Clostridia bacterium]